jgi:hypothetical protein
VGDASAEGPAAEATTEPKPARRRSAKAESVETASADKAEAAPTADATTSDEPARKRGREKKDE